MSDHTKSNQVASFVTSLLSTKMNLILVLILVGVAFYVGSLWTKVDYLEKQVTTTGGVINTNQAQVPQAQPTPDMSPKAVPLDDDPVLGDANAPVTIVEFSDYECPFCKSFYDQALVEIKKNYIDTGKVKLVFRDFPLPFHDPMATNEAVAANCAREQGDDEAYYEYHDEIFKRTTSNGNGLSTDDLPEIAEAIGLNVNEFNSCLEDPQMKEEVKKDMADAGTVGASATPMFYVGPSSNTGTIQGTPVIGAQPYSAFESLIEEALKK